MRLAEMLSYAAMDQLHQLARTYACDCNIHSKNELIQSLLTSIKRKDRMQRQLEKLSIAEFNFLLHLVFDLRTEVTLEDLQAKARFAYTTDSNRDTYRKLVAVALKRGWVFRKIGRHTSALFSLPKDMRTLWVDVIVQQERKHCAVYTQPNVYREEGAGLIDDVRTFLHYSLNHEPALTTEGVLYRRNQKQLLSLLSVQEEPVEKGAWRFGYGRHYKAYPDRFSLIYNFCYYHQYIREDAKAGLLVTEQAAEVDQLPDDWLMSEMVQFWLRMYKRPISGLPMLVRFVGQVAKSWTAEMDLVVLLGSKIKAHYYEQPDDMAKMHVLQMMVYLGILRQGLTDTGTYLYQTTPFGMSMLETIEVGTMQEIVFDE